MSEVQLKFLKYIKKVEAFTITMFNINTSKNLYPLNINECRKLQAKISSMLDQ